jgi:hypothetical protein
LDERRNRCGIHKYRLAAARKTKRHAEQQRGNQVEKNQNSRYFSPQFVRHGDPDGQQHNS